jgi:SSS family solute:Na+ symporter
MGKLHIADIFVLLLYFAGMIGISVYYYKKIKSSDSFAVADRTLTMPIMVGTTVATCIGAATAFGQVGMIHNLGVAGLYSIFGWHIGWIALVIMSKPLRASGASTLPEFLNIKFGLKAKRIAGVVSLVFLINATAAQVAAVGTIFEALELSTFKTGAIIGGIAIIIYTIFGGLYAVSVTDTIQAVLLFLGVAIAVPIIAYSQAGGVAYVFSNLGPEKLNWTDFNMSELLPLTLGYVLAAGSHAAYSQRIFASRDVKVAYVGSILSNVIALIIQSLIAISALTIPFIFPSMTNGEMLVPAVIATYMPPVLTGFVLASLIGVVLSTADSFLLLVGTTFANDIVNAIRPNTPNDKLLKIARITTFVGGVACIILALYGGSVLTLFKTGAAAYGAGMFIPLFLGCFWKDTSSNGVVVGMLAGCFATIIWNLLLKSSTGIDGVIIGAILCLVSIVSISLLDKNKTKISNNTI